MTTPAPETPAKPPEAIQAQGPVRGSSVAATLCMVSLSNYAANALIVLGPWLLRHFNITSTQMGALFAVPLLGGIPALLVIGPLSDRYGAKTILRVSFIGLAAADCLCAVALRLPVFFVALAAAGFFSMGAVLAAPAYMARLYPNNQRQALALAFTALTVPWVVFPPLIEWLATRFPDHFAYVLHVPFAAVAVLLLAGQFLLARVPSDRQPSHIFSLREGMRQLRQPVLIVVFVVVVLHSTADMSFQYWFPTYAREHFADMVPSPGVVIGLCALGYVVARGALALTPEGFGRRHLLIAPGILGGLILLGCVWADKPLVLGIGYPVAALVWAAELPAAMAEASGKALAYFSSFMAATTIASQVCTAGGVAFTGAMLTAANLGDKAPWWMPDARVAMSLPVLGFILFGVIAWVTGLGREERRHGTTGSAAD